MGVFETVESGGLVDSITRALNKSGSEEPMDPESENQARKRSPGKSLYFERPLESLGAGFYTRIASTGAR